jgi:hypothetical protein
MHDSSETNTFLLMTVDNKNKPANSDAEFLNKDGRSIYHEILNDRSVGNTASSAVFILPHDSRRTNVVDAGHGPLSSRVRRCQPATGGRIRTVNSTSYTETSPRASLSEMFQWFL